VDRITKKQKFKLVLTNPPFGRGQGKDVTDSEILKQYRLGRNREKQSPQILFIELCIGLLEDGGRLLTVIDDGILNNSTLGYVRDFIKEQTIVKAVISLPRGTFNPYGSGVKSSVLYVQKKKNLEQKHDLKDLQEPLADMPEKQGDIFMAIANYVGFDTRRRTRYIQTDKNDLLNIENVGMQQIK
jgi:type I restriction enzyme M protein